MTVTPIGRTAVVLVATAMAAALSTSGAAQDLTGAGATFPAPIYSKWFNDYSVKTGVQINYQPIGSGGGVRQIAEQTVDFGASDGPMSDEELGKAKGGAVLRPGTNQYLGQARAGIGNGIGHRAAT